MTINHDNLMQTHVYHPTEEEMRAMEARDKEMLETYEGYDFDYSGGLEQWEKDFYSQKIESSGSFGADWQSLNRIKNIAGSEAGGPVTEEEINKVFADIDINSNGKLDQYETLIASLFSNDDNSFGFSEQDRQALNQWKTIRGIKQGDEITEADYDDALDWQVLRREEKST